MNFEEFYGDALPVLKLAEKHILNTISEYPGFNETPEGIQEIIYCRSRIKSPESMTEKLRRKELPVNLNSALYKVNDAIGVRVVCSFADDVYNVYRWFSGHPDFEIINVKDYIANPKPNGYRSLHLIIKIVSGDGCGLTAEIQLRTIATDFWAALEHQMKYKHEITHEELIRNELKRCADEIASVDLSMQTLRDIIMNNSWDNEA